MRQVQTRESSTKLEHTTMKWIRCIIVPVLASTIALAGESRDHVSATSLTNRLQQVLPQGWFISSVDSDATSMTIELAIRGKQYAKQQAECVLFLMPTNYVLNPDPHESERQSPSPRLLGDTPEYRVLFWGWWLSSQWPTMNKDILGAISGQTNSTNKSSQARVAPASKPER